MIGLLLAVVSASAAIWASRRQETPEPVLGGTIVYTAPTANQAAIRIGGSAREMLERAGAGHQVVRVVRIEGNGAVSTSTVDMTPRIDGKPDGEPLKVAERAAAEIDRLIATMQSQLNQKSSAVGGEALFAGLSRARIDVSRPVFIFSSGLDTTDPVDFRKLAFDVAPSTLAGELRAAGELPALQGAMITFAVLGESGRQPVLRRPQVVYRETLWTTLLRASGAPTVRYEYPDGEPSTSTLPAPVVPIPPPPSTPVPAKTTKVRGEKTCTLSAATYFASDQAVLLDRRATLRALAPCAATIGTTGRVSVEGHTSSVAKRPNNPVAIRLSTQRAQVVADLLVQLKVARNRIDVRGYGNAKQPFPDPSDPRNRCVVVRFNNAS
ncbi:OmpA family protein [Kribbella sp. NPDC049174]|uniref:OmpA family protein n=1 Tax=Kribbella sp. NPDC049174 TaxID=3364112 RepID=UPI0037208776